VKGPVAKARDGEILLMPGFPCRTAPSLVHTADECSWFPVDPACIKNRKAATAGTILTWPPGTGGSVWLVSHEDGGIAAYTPDEVEDIL
jgi:hypothetical protein